MIENLSLGGGGDAGVVGFTPSQNTAAPNNTVNASRLLVDAASTNADAVVQPKGTGALLAQLPDGAVAGGNKRGANAVDLQTSRTNSAQVASGINSFIGAGLNNTVTGAYSAIVGGNQNTASGAAAFIASGELNTASGDFSCALGSFAVANRRGMLAHASGRFGSNGDAQREEYVLRRSTVNDTPTELTADGSNGGATNRMSIATDSAYAFSALIVGRATAADNNSAGYKIEGVIDNNAGTTAFVGTPTVTVLGEDTAAWDCTAVADNTNDALVIQVTGAAATTIIWVASVRLVKVTG